MSDTKWVTDTLVCPECLSEDHGGTWRPDERSWRCPDGETRKDPFHYSGEVKREYEEDGEQWVERWSGYMAPPSNAPVYAEGSEGPHKRWSELYPEWVHVYYIERAAK